MFDPVALIALLCVSVALLVGASIKRIPEGHVYTLRRLGRPQPRLLMPGTHIVVPLFERVRHKISLTGRTLPLDAEPEPQLHGTVYWQVLDPQQADAIIDGAEALIREHVRAALAAPAAPEESEIARSLRIKLSLNAELKARGMLVTRVDLRPH